MSDDSDCNSPKLHSQVKVLFETRRQSLNLKGGIPSFLSGTQLLFPLAIKYVTHQIRKLALNCHPLNSSPKDKLGEGALVKLEPCVMQAKLAGIHGNPWERQQPDTVTLINQWNTCQGHTMKTRNGWVSGSKKALNYGMLGRQTANENVAETQSKGPCNKAHKCKPQRMAATNHRWQRWLKFNFA